MEENRQEILVNGVAISEGEEPRWSWSRMSRIALLVLVSSVAAVLLLSAYNTAKAVAMVDDLYYQYKNHSASKQQVDDMKYMLYEERFIFRWAIDEDTLNGARALIRIFASEDHGDRDPSNHFSNYEAYREEVDRLNEINDSQRVGGDPKEPSVAAPPDTTVDNNVNVDSGYGSIDAPTPVAPLATIAGTGEPISSEPNVAWEGPADA